MSDDNSSARKMSDVELSKALGRYQTLERIGTVIGIILAGAGMVSAFIQHDVVLFAVLFFAGVAVIVFICGTVNRKKNALLNSELGDFMHTELFKAFGRPTGAPTMMINDAYLRNAGLISICWDECNISNFYEAEHNGIRFSTANVVLTKSVEERSGPDNDNWMTKTVTVFKGVAVRCANIRPSGFDIIITDRMHESPPKGDVSNPAVFRERFSVRTPDGRDAMGLVTPQLAAMCSRLESAVSGNVCGLEMRGGNVSAMLNTRYQFANVPPNTDLRNIDGIRKAYVESIETIITLLDILKNNL